MDLRIAWRNVWRHPRRTLLTLAAVAFAAMLLIFMLSWQFGSYDTMIASAVKAQTGHLQIQRQNYQDQQRVSQVVPDPDRVGLMLADMPGVLGYAFRTKAFSLLSFRDRTYGGLVIGIEPTREAGVSTLKQLVHEGAYLTDTDENQALVGRLLAKNLRITIGQELVLVGQGRDGSIAASALQVKGIFASGHDALDRSTIHIPLKHFQEVYAMEGSVHEIVVMCRDLEHVDRVKTILAEQVQRSSEAHPLVVLDWKELMPGLIQSIQMDLVSGLIFYLILIVVVAFSILNTFLMAIFERKKEFGVLMALGTTPGRLTRLMLLESATTTLMGVGLGMVCGCLVTLYFQHNGIVISGATELLRQYGMPERMYPKLSMLSIAIGAGIVLGITGLTALFPALKIRRLGPVEALRA